MKVLVTGATGFIGNYVVNALLKKDFQVIATSKNQKKAREYNWYKKVRYVPYNLDRNKKNLWQFFQKPDIAIHLAWNGLQNYKDLNHFEIILFRHYRFLKNLIEGGLTSLTVAGTCLEYGLQTGCLSEEAQVQPITSYGLAKDTLRRFLMQLKLKYKFSFKWLRLFYIYGEGQNQKSLLANLEMALVKKQKEFKMTKGNQIRDYLHVVKLAQYIVEVATQNKTEGIINCCSGNSITLHQLVNNYLKEKHYKIKLNLGFYPYCDYEPMAFWGDNRKLKQILNNKKKIKLIS